MAKRPNFNPGTGGGIGRPLPDVDANPDTNPATAALAAGAAVKTDHVTMPPGQSELSGLWKALGQSMPPKPSLPALEKPRFSLLAADITLLDAVATEYRRATGQGVTPSRIVRAALRAFAGNPERQALIAAVEELKPGRKPRV